MATNDRILVSVPEMRDAVSRYESARATLDEAFTQLKNAKEHLDRCYAGPAYAVLCAKYANIFLNIKTAENAVQETISGLNNTMAEMEAAESGNKGTYESLEKGAGPTVYNSGF